MSVLAIDTSANLCSAALYDVDARRVLSCKSENIGRGHAERLMGLLGEVLAGAGQSYRDITRVAVTCGPGSFTGVRVGLAAARGLALGLGVPVLGVTTFEAHAAEYTGDVPLAVVLHARRGEVFFQMFMPSGITAGEPRLLAIDDVTATLPNGPVALAGSAASDVAECAAAAKFTSDITVFHNNAAPDISSMARHAAGLPLPKNRPEPLYLRAADAKPQEGFGVALSAN